MSSLTAFAAEVLSFTWDILKIVIIVEAVLLISGRKITEPLK